MHGTPPGHAVTAGQPRAQPRNQPAQHGESRRGRRERGRPTLDAAAHVEHAARQRQGMPRLHQRHQQHRREAAGQRRRQRQHDIGDDFCHVIRRERADERTQQVERAAGRRGFVGHRC